MRAKTRNNPISGAGYVLQGLTLIRQKGVKRYVVIPLLINILLFVVAILLFAAQLPLLMGWLVQMLPAWLVWLSWLSVPLFVIVSALLVLLSFTVVGNIIAAPFNSRLAEVVEERLTVQTPGPPEGWRRLPGNVLHGLYSEIQKLVYFTVRAIPLLIIMVIPGLNLVSPILWLLFSSWVLALEYADYPMANHGIGFRRQRQLLQKRRFLALGYGGMLTLVLLVPGLNLFLIPAGVAGATAMWVEQLSGAVYRGEDKSPSS